MIEPATERDRPDIRALLERLQLPLAGVDEHLPTMLVVRVGEHIVGIAGLPPSVRESVEFQSACPASAIAMRKQLQ